MNMFCRQNYLLECFKLALLSHLATYNLETALLEVTARVIGFHMILQSEPIV